MDDKFEYKFKYIKNMRFLNIMRNTFIFSTVFLLAAVSCSSTPDAKPRESAIQISKKTNVKKRLYAHFSKWKGVRYKEGGNDKKGVDCSGFVQLTFMKALGIALPRSTGLLVKQGKSISAKQLAVGDLVFFKTGYSKQHVGIYIGNDQFIHASTSQGVIKSNMKSPYWSKHYWTSRRIIRS